MRILLIDDHWPRASLGAGNPRGAQTLRALAAISDEVVVCPVFASPAADLQASGAALNVRWSRLATPVTPAALTNWLGAAPRFDVIWVGRPHNMVPVADARRMRPDRMAGTRVIYDAEAVFALRAIRQRAVEGRPASEVRAGHLIRRELYPIEAADAVVAVSAFEVAFLAQRLRQPVTRLGYAAEVRLQETPFAERQGLLFVGPVNVPGGPNDDSLRWFLGTVSAHFPASRPVLTVAGLGSEPDGRLAAALAPGDLPQGQVDDLRPLYARARVFVAPTRFAAGIPLKVIDAARHGLPVVATSMLAEQLGWRDGIELLAADSAAGFAEAVRRLHDDPQLWSRLRSGAVAAVRRDYDPARFDATVRDVALPAASAR